jgi:hypothetical protein
VARWVADPKRLEFFFVIRFSFRGDFTKKPTTRRKKAAAAFASTATNSASSISSALGGWGDIERIDLIESWKRGVV